MRPGTPTVVMAVRDPAAFTVAYANCMWGQPAATDTFCQVSAKQAQVEDLYSLARASMFPSAICAAQNMRDGLQHTTDSLLVWAWESLSFALNPDLAAHNARLPIFKIMLVAELLCFFDGPEYGVPPVFIFVHAD